MKQETLQFHKVAPEMVHNGAIPYKNRHLDFLESQISIYKYYIDWIHDTCPIIICVIDIDYIPLSNFHQCSTYCINIGPFYWSKSVCPESVCFSNFLILLISYFRWLKTDNIYIYIKINSINYPHELVGYPRFLLVISCNISIYRVGRPPQFLLVESHFFKNTTMNSC